MERIMPATLSGPFTGAVMAQLSTWLATERYAPATTTQIQAVARDLSSWMADHDLTLGHLTSDLLADFAAQYPPHVAGHALVTQRIPPIRRFLLDTGHLPSTDRPRKRPRRPVAQTPPPLPRVVAAELDAWATWQHTTRGISPGCIRTRRHWITPLLVSLLLDDDHLDWAACTVSTLNAFIVTRSAGFSPASRALIVDATRALMRWALATGRLDDDPTGGILRVRTSRTRLPQGLTPAQLTALRDTCDVTTIIGTRDLAVITILSRLGLRAGETAHLSLDDLDWHAGQLTVIGKGHRRLTLPIPNDLGDILVAWLHLRPASTDRAVFVRVRPPIHGLTSSGISTIIAHRGVQAGLGVLHAHRLRHTAATNILAAGGSVIEAQELLGHQHSTSTHAYARTDLASLRTLATAFGVLPW